MLKDAPQATCDGIQTYPSYDDHKAIGDRLRQKVGEALEGCFSGCCRLVDPVDEQDTNLATRGTTLGHSLEHLSRPLYQLGVRQLYQSRRFTRRH